jgi:hypothetical protein
MQVKLQSSLCPFPDISGLATLQKKKCEVSLTAQHMEAGALGRAHRVKQLWGQLSTTPLIIRFPTLLKTQGATVANTDGTKTLGTEVRESYDSLASSRGANERAKLTGSLQRA